MATVYIRFGGAMGGGAPVLATIPNATATVTSSGTSQVAPIVATSGDYLRVSATGGVVRLAVGGSPVAENDAGDWVLDGQTVDLGPLSQGDRIAVIDAS
jgi:hypothetical protein